MVSSPNWKVHFAILNIFWVTVTNFVVFLDLLTQRMLNPGLGNIMIWVNVDAISSVLSAGPASKGV